MVRSRIPKPYGIFQLTLRALGLCLDLIALAFLARFAILLHRDGSVWGVPLAGLLVALTIDSLEVFALSNASHYIPRPKTSVIIFMDLAAIGTGLGGLVCLIVSGLPCCEEPYISEKRWRMKVSWVDAAIWSYCAFLGLRGVILFGIDCCCVGGRAERKRKSRAMAQAESESARETAVEEPAPPYEMEIEGVGPRTDMVTAMNTVIEGR